MMESKIKGKRKNLAKQFFRRTQKLPEFSVNELREMNLDSFFDTPLAHGAFFTDLMKDGYTTHVGYTKVRHEKGNRRKVKTWNWTYHARKHLRTLPLVR